MMRKRGDRPAPTRLAYSTGGAAEKGAPPAAAPRAASPRGIRLRLEARPGGRAVTLVIGLGGTDEQLAALLRDLKSACGAGGTLKDGVLELQGDHRKAAQAALLARGLKARI